MLSLVETTAFRLESKSCKGFKKNKISTNESTQIITGHVIYNPAYTYKFQLKTTPDTFSQSFYKIWLTCWFISKLNHLTVSLLKLTSFSQNYNFFFQLSFWMKQFVIYIRSAEYMSQWLYIVKSYRNIFFVCTITFCNFSTLC